MDDSKSVLEHVEFINLGSGSLQISGWNVYAWKYLCASRDKYCRCNLYAGQRDWPRKERAVRGPGAGAEAWPGPGSGHPRQNNAMQISCNHMQSQPGDRRQDWRTLRSRQACQGFITRSLGCEVRAAGCERHDARCAGEDDVDEVGVGTQFACQKL